MQRQEWLKPRMDQLFEVKARQEASGRNFNTAIQSGREYRNPRICEKLIEMCKIHQYGTNLPKEHFDPEGWRRKPEAFYDSSMYRRIANQRLDSASKAFRRAAASTPSAPRLRLLAGALTGVLSWQQLYNCGNQHQQTHLRFLYTTSIVRASDKCNDESGQTHQQQQVPANSNNKGGNKYSTILLSNPSKHVAHVQLNRPKARNAFGLDSALELKEALNELDDDSSIRCLVLSGNGPDLTSGVDLKSFMGAYAQLQESEDVGRRAKLLRSIIVQFQAPFKRMDSFSKPIICVQHGLCYGLGMELAACSDIRYCSSEVKMAIREVLIGIAADVGSLQLMPRLVNNQSVLRELIYTGRDISANEALQLGFVSKVCSNKEEALNEALETAKLIASRSPVAIQGSKRNLAFSCDKSLQVGLDYNAVWNASMMQSGDVVKAITAIMSKSEIEFDDH